MRIIAQATKALGARADFRRIYEDQAAKMDPRVNALIQRVGSTAASEVYPYAETAPVIRYWPTGSAIPRDVFTTQNFRVPNWDFGISAMIGLNDEADDQISVVTSRMVQMAESAAALAERNFYLLLANGAVSDAAQLVPIIPTAPDGVGMFSGVDGKGNPRFGAVNGNAIPGSGVGSALAIQTDLSAVLSQFAAFKNTQNQPLFLPSSIQKGVTVFYNSLNNFVWQQALNQQQNAVTVGAAAAPASNITIDSGWKITPVPNSRLTTNTWYAFAEGMPFQAVGWQEREAPVTTLAEPGNSDASREFKAKLFYLWLRAGLILSLPYGVCSVN